MKNRLPQRCHRLLPALAAAAIAVAAAPIAVRAADAAPPGREWRYELYDGLMSPFCPGRTLMDCPSSQAAELRDWITEQEQAGRSKEDVEAQLYAKFGDVILQAPKASGFGLAAYVIPAIGVVLGAALVVVFLRRQSLRALAGRPAPAAGAPLDPDLERLIDEEMEGRGRS
jgi:cytochrome c-type biogenesis protein CcmH